MTDLSELLKRVETAERPVRIQLSRRKGWRMPPNTVKVCRPTKWGNPMRAGEEILACGEPVVDGRGPLVQRKATPEDAVRYYRNLALKLPPGSFEPLRGKNLACWCQLCPEHKDGKPLDLACSACDPCHTDVLLDLANRPHCETVA